MLTYQLWKLPDLNFIFKDGYPRSPYQQPFAKLFFNAINCLVQFDCFLCIIKQAYLVITRNKIGKPNAN